MSYGNARGTTIPCDCVTPGNGYCKRVMTSTAESKRVLFSVGLWLRAAQFVRLCSTIGHTSGLKGPSPQALTLLRGVRFIAWCLRCP